MRTVDTQDMAWKDAGKAGLRMKTVRRDDQAGTFLGLIAFDAMASTGVHQHLGPAFSYMLAGGLTDFAGTARRGEVGINLLGSTHDAIAYQPTLMVSRLEGPVIYGPEISHGLHAGAVHLPVDNRFPDMPPDCNIELESLTQAPTWVPGVTRRMVFDYLPTAFNRRLIDLTFLPGAAVPRHVLGGVLDLYLIAGDLSVGEGAGALAGGGFLTCDRGDEISLTSRYGAHALVWSEAPSVWSDGRTGPDFYGFDASFRSPWLSKR